MLRRFFSSLTLLGLLVFPLTALAQDTSVPSDVERLHSLPGNASVRLNWDVATDDVGVTGYKIYYGTDSVKNQNQNIYSETTDAGNVIEYSLTGLKNGTPYYFAVTAYDAAGNESNFYSPEVSSTPEVSLFTASALSEFGDTAVSKTSTDAAKTPAGIAPTAADALPPKVVKATATDKNLVKVIFSEKITLPTKSAESAFVIQDNLTLENLKVLSATLYADDSTGVTVLLKTEEQIPGTEYVLTAGPEITDTDSQSVVSGKEDSALFAGVKGPVADATAVGGDATPVKTENAGSALFGAAEEKPFSLTKIEVIGEDILNLTFSEPVVLSLDPVENFLITQKDNTDNKLEITGVELNDSNTIVTLTTAKQEKVSYTLSLEDIVNVGKKSLDSDKTQFDFEGFSAPTDTTPPEDVRSLVGKIIKGLGVKLQWKGSINSAGDLLEYIVYQSSGNEQNYGKLLALPNDATLHQVDGLTPGDYFFKVSARDASGNESAGKTVKVRLVESGPGIGLLGLISIGLGRVLGRKKKTKK
ncbi:MAG: fibronectin type III domain-containing protein [Patescibacteria group bacterium]